MFVILKYLGVKYLFGGLYILIRGLEKFNYRDMVFIKNVLLLIFVCMIYLLYW